MQATLARCARCSQLSPSRTCLVSGPRHRQVGSYTSTSDARYFSSSSSSSTSSSSKSVSADKDRFYSQRNKKPNLFPPLFKARVKPPPAPKQAPVYVHADLDVPPSENSRFDFFEPNLRKKPRPPLPPMQAETFGGDTAIGLTEILKTNKTTDPKALFGILAGWLLRHEARNMGYGVSPDGFVRVSDALRFPPFNSYSVAEFARLAETDEKDRFEISRLPDFIEGVIEDVWWVRARHMHSIPGVNAKNKRIINMTKLHIVEYRTRPENWAYIKKNGIPEGPDHLIRLYTSPAKGLFLENIPFKEKILSVTIDTNKAAQLGVMFYHTNDVRLYAVGTREKGIIPTECFRSAVILDISKEALK